MQALRREALEATQALVTFFIEYACTDDASEALNIDDAQDYYSLCKRLLYASQFEKMHNALVVCDDDEAQYLYDELESECELYMTEDQYDALYAFFERHLKYIDARDSVQTLYDSLQ